MPNSFAAFATWTGRYREKITDAGWLLLALNAPKILLGLPRTPWLFQLGLLAVFAFVASPKTLASASVWTRYRHALPSYLITSAVGTASFILWLKLPAALWWFAPIWLGLVTGSRLPLAAFYRQTATWMQARRLEIPLGDAALVILFSLTTPAWAQQSGPAWWMLVLLLAAWAWLNRAIKTNGFNLAPVIGLALVWGLLWLPLGGLAALKPALVFSAWLALALVTYRFAARRWVAVSASGFAENMRWIGLSAILILFFHPFFRAGIHGSGDALYYATFLADTLTQFRHGIFPVFVGQSEYQFNGSVIPIRIAPGFQYLGGLVDLLSLRTLSPIAVQNAVITLTAGGVLVGTYVAFRWLRQTASLAWTLAVLYLICPGVMGLAFNSDLYMSWLTAPWVLVTLVLGVRGFEAPTVRLSATLGICLGLTWWMHAPIALWLTLFMTGVQAVRIIRPVSSVKKLVGELSAGAGSFLAVASYPIVSATFYPADPALGAGGGFNVPPIHILQQIMETFPASWLPLSVLGRLLSDFQIGYGLLGLGLLSIPLAWQTGRREVRTLVILAGLVLLLLAPIPALSLKVWELVPATVRTVTNVWVMQRLYVLLAAIMVLYIGVAWNAPKLSRARVIALTVAFLWSFAEALKFLHGSLATVTPEIASVHRLASENITLTRYSYGLFSRKPVYFTHGTTDPLLENRLLADDLQTIIASNYEAAVKTDDAGLTLNFANIEGHVETAKPIPLVQGKHYLLKMVADPEAVKGTLVLSGQQFQRVYALPEYGEAKSFGLGGAHNQFLPLHTTRAKGETLKVLFVSSVPVDPAALATSTALELREYSPEKLPVQMESWLPYQARVSSAGPAWLETPRMYQSAYAATVDGHAAEVKVSKEGLAAVRVPAGTSQVELRYVAPRGMLAAFWISFTAVSVGLLWFITRAIRAIRTLA